MKKDIWKMLLVKGPLGVLAAILVVAVVVACVMVPLKFMWDWTIPGLFPKAVADGYIVGSLAWDMAFYLIVLVFLITHPWVIAVLLGKPLVLFLARLFD